MKKKLFLKLVESITQMNEMIRGERALSRGFVMGVPMLKKLTKCLWEKEN